MMIALGVATGCVEALILWTKQAAFGQVIFVSRHALWMTPSLYALIFGALGVLLGALALVFPTWVTAPFAVFVGVSFGVGCLFLPVGAIHRIAAAILSAGIGVQMARYTRERPARARRLLGGALVTLVALSAAAGAVGEVLRRTDSSGFAGPVSGMRTGMPNVLLVVWDTVRSASLSLYGHARPTSPVLERLARESVVFDRAFSASPWTLPGHSTLFTGRWPHELSSSWYSRLDDAEPTMAEVFRTAGYTTGGFVANHHYTSYDSGLGRGFDVYQDYRVSREQFLLSSAFTQTRSGGRMVRARSLSELWSALREFNWYVDVKRGSDRKHSDDINDEFLTWVDGLGSQPFFGFLNYFDAHAGYWSPPEFKRFGQGAEAAYEAAIAYQDDRLGTLLEELERRGVLENTLVIFTSDHGELFGEHGLNGHAHNLYLPVLHVPLLIRYPGGVPAGVRVGAEVSLRDVPATVLDLAGIDAGGVFPGNSLTRYWSGTPQEAASLLAEVQVGRNNPPTDPISRGPVRSVLQDGWQYILNGDGVEELYDYAGRPGDETNLVELPEHQARRSAMRAWLEHVVPESATTGATSH